MIRVRCLTVRQIAWTREQSDYPEEFELNLTLAIGPNKLASA